MRMPFRSQNQYALARRLRSPQWFSAFTDLIQNIQSGDFYAGTRSLSYHSGFSTSDIFKCHFAEKISDLNSARVSSFHVRFTFAQNEKALCALTLFRNRIAISIISSYYFAGKLRQLVSIKNLKHSSICKIFQNLIVTFTNFLHWICRVSCNHDYLTINSSCMNMKCKSSNESFGTIWC